MNIDLVSIVSPIFNGKKSIELTYASILSQTYQNWEWLVVDDGSTDGSREWLSQISLQDKRVVVLLNSNNQGAAYARNQAIAAAKGRFIAFLDADDQWAPEKLEIQLKEMDERDLDFCYTSYDLVTSGKTKIGVRKAPISVSYTSLLKCNEVGCSTAIYDLKRLGKVYMPLLRKRQDLGLWLKLVKLGAKAGGVDKSLVQYTVGTNSLSANKWKVLKYQWAIYRQLERLSFIHSLYYFTCYVWNGLTRYRL
ncbi:glycosyltransferase family 2 protein [Vibrio fluvialis]|uniref:glycosyltransferase family 2 protein n=1 Tax=Vibrio fluvialis TaxID=676 RepID=UPI001404AD26|nr:glycosyltransferase family 2 protein [Vibrio fluvialis]ELO1774998.1 glycosyltransferase family 2 protein [Vibrio fluvialis]MBL4307364.1 glycosyltransferase family 2 protein [Vibrio fluvialis]MBY7812946.1 glycosyltransferase [Vibrio fluvialis]MBY7864270.1 glycosyltransferase [Vibrio fluvialis]MBY8082973.1 glycosyltransferase [Vibrio fluvialis]